MWAGDGREWDYDGISNVTVDQVNNKVTFQTKHTGAYAVVAGTTLRITTPVYVPGCGEYTGRWPAMFTTIEDLLYGIDGTEIKVILDGPAGNKVFDNMTLYYHEEPMDGIVARVRRSVAQSLPGARPRLGLGGLLPEARPACAMVCLRALTR